MSVHISLLFRPRRSKWSISAQMRSPRSHQSSRSSSARSLGSERGLIAHRRTKEGAPGETCSRHVYTHLGRSRERVLKTVVVCRRSWAVAVSPTYSPWTASCTKGPNEYTSSSFASVNSSIKLDHCLLHTYSPQSIPRVFSVTIASINEVDHLHQDKEKEIIQLPSRTVSQRSTMTSTR